VEDSVAFLVESDDEINGADEEDNVTLTDLEDDAESISLTGDKEKYKDEEEFNLNISFTGGYIPNTDLSRVDKGQGNP
jgi:hypothetical protein